MDDPPARSTSRAGWAARWLVASGCLAGALAIILRYPIQPAVIGFLTLAYAAGLWFRPGLWLIAIPALVVGVDLSPLTGWMMIGEADPFILATIGVLAIRQPPTQRELWPHGQAGLAITAVLGVTLVGLARGLWGTPGLIDGSDLAYLRPDNAVRLAKPLLIALALLPFLRERQLRRGDAFGLFSGGMALALVVVALQVLAERVAFASAFDISGYPVSAAFASMHVGGNHLADFFVIAAPFAIVYRPANSVWGRSLLRLAVIAGLYGLIVTFSRGAYAAALLAALTMLLSRYIAASGGLGERAEIVMVRFVVRAGYIGLLASTLIVALLGIETIQTGVARLIDNLELRQHHMAEKLALVPDGPAGFLFGAGSGSFGRLHASQTDAPSNFVVRTDGAVPYLSLVTGPGFFLGQKVSLSPGGEYRVNVSVRSPGGISGLSVLLCEKQLLVSANCRGLTFPPDVDGWRSLSGSISAEGLERADVPWPWRRSVELSLATTNSQAPVEIASFSLTDADGRELVANGDFRAGTARWSFTDDNHDAWQIMNQYVMLLFEGGSPVCSAFSSCRSRLPSGHIARCFGRSRSASRS